MKIATWLLRFNSGLGAIGLSGAAMRDGSFAESLAASLGSPGFAATSAVVLGGAAGWAAVLASAGLFSDGWGASAFTAVSTGATGAAVCAIPLGWSRNDGAASPAVDSLSA